MRLFRNTTDLVLLSTFVVLSLLLIFGAMAGTMANYRRAVDQETVAAQNMASILAANIEQRLNTLDAATKAAAAAVSPTEIFTDAELAAAAPFLRSWSLPHTDVYGLYIVGIDGRLVSSSMDGTLGTDMKERLDFAIARGTWDAPFVTGLPHEAVAPALKGRWILTVGRLLYTEDRQLRGMLAAGVSVEAMEGTMDRLFVAPNTTIQFLTADNRVALQRPRGDRKIGSHIARADSLPMVPRDTVQTDWDGPQQQLVAFQRLQKNFGTIVVTKPLSVVLSNSQWHSAIVALLTSAVIGLLGALLLGLRRFLGERQRAADELAAVLSNVSDGVFALDAQNRFVFANREAERMLKRNLDRMHGRPVIEALPDNRMAAGLTEQLDRARQSLQPIVLRVADEDDPGGDLWYDVRIYPGRDRTATVYVRDVSEEVAREERMRQTQKLETIGQLTGGVAHDFNNILTIIILNLELMAGQVPEQAERALKAALSAAERGATLTDRLLAFARKQPLKPAAQEVRAILNDCETLLRPGLGDLYSLKIAVADGVSPVLADRNQLTNALVNLILNARDAMPAGGRIVVEATQRSIALAEPDAAGGGRVPTAGSYVVLSVSDDGTGMSPETVARAFEPFFTTKPVGKGTGLGLSMVWGFARQSGGHAEIYSEIGSGTVVKLLLPAARGPEEELPLGHRDGTASLAAPDKDKASARPRAILLVEDDSELRAAALERLRAKGHTVYAVQDAVMAEDLLARLPADRRIELLVSDVVLPGGVMGPELAQRLQERFGRLQVLYTSGYTATVLSQRGILPEGAILLTKPYTASELLQAVAQVGIAHDVTLQELPA